MTGKARALVALALGAAVAVAAFATLTAGGDRDEPSSADRARDAPRHEGRVVFASMGCGSCHRLAAAGSTGAIGPDLDARLAGHTRASLVDAIVRMPRRRASAMPDDYGSRMTDAQLDALVDYLLALGFLGRG
jgi:mono/diheme cytochrome c family protein